MSSRPFLDPPRQSNLIFCLLLHLIAVGVSQGAVLRNILIPLVSVTASPPWWALHRIKLIQEYKENHNRDSHIFRQLYLLIISSPSRYYFHPCVHFCEFLSAEIDPLKLWSLRDKFADIHRSCDDETGAVLAPCCQATAFPTQQPKELQPSIPGKITVLSIPLGA